MPMTIGELKLQHTVLYFLFSFFWRIQNVFDDSMSPCWLSPMDYMVINLPRVSISLLVLSDCKTKLLLWNLLPLPICSLWTSDSRYHLIRPPENHPSVGFLSDHIISIKSYGHQRNSCRWSEGKLCNRGEHKKIYLSIFTSYCGIPHCMNFLILATSKA